MRISAMLLRAWSNVCRIHIDECLARVGKRELCALGDADGMFAKDRQFLGYCDLPRGISHGGERRDSPNDCKNNA
ncbi:hypothetical protein [Rhizobium leguminosarum]